MTVERLPWFKCFPGKLLGALAGMEPDDGYLYCVILFRIYEVGGPIKDTPKALGRRTGMGEKRAANALESLRSSGKVTVDDGAIDSFTTREHLQDTKRVEISAIIGGKASAEKRREKTQSIQQMPPTTLEEPLNDQSSKIQRPFNDRSTILDRERVPNLATVSTLSPDRFEELLLKLLKAAGFENTPTRRFEVLGEIIGRIEGGMDLERDILPPIRKAAAAGAVYKAKSWNYFLPAIDEAFRGRSNGHAIASSMPAPEKTYDLGAGVEITEANLIVQIQKPSRHWREMFFGSDSDFREAVVSKAPHLAALFEPAALARSM